MEKTEAQAEMLFNRLVKRWRHLRKWAGRTDVEAYRLYDRDIPEIPLVLDWYGAAGGAALAGSLYKRPYEKDEAEETLWLETMKAAAAGALGLLPENIFLRLRQRQKGPAQYGPQAEKHVLREVRERGLRFRVNLSGYLDTGLFLDRRLFRALVRREAAGRRVLNLFSYTGTLSAAAAAGGAVLVDSVDLSAAYQNWARENFALNGFKAHRAPPEAFFAGLRTRAAHSSAQTEAAPASLIRADALRFVEDALRQKPRPRWDMIILDPPAFSNSKKMRGDFDFKRDHPALLQNCLRLLSPGGVLYLSASVKGFKPDETALAGASAEDITEKLRDEDFRGKRIPGTWRIVPDAKEKVY